MGCTSAMMTNKNTPLSDLNYLLRVLDTLSSEPTNHILMNNLSQRINYKDGYKALGSSVIYRYPADF